MKPASSATTSSTKSRPFAVSVGVLVATCQCTSSFEYHDFAPAMTTPPSGPKAALRNDVRLELGSCAEFVQCWPSLLTHSCTGASAPALEPRPPVSTHRLVPSPASVTGL